MNISLLTLTFLAVNLDFFIMLLFLLKKYPFRVVLMAYLLGNLFLMMASFLAGQVLEAFLPEWLLGVLGFIPIYLAFRDDDDDEDDDAKGKSPFWIVLGTYLSVCAGCNLSIFLPVLLGESWLTFAETLLYIGVLTVIIVFVLRAVADNKVVTSLIDRFGEKLMKICYILIGLYVLLDSGFLVHVYELIVKLF
ncbi:Cadmium resistance protein CadD [Fructobacillus fructosus]|uniref:cadmium resistance transporter n=1 Tax=Fructobacillus fructosus TaxID=1631 RepID=UPI000219591A|nr:cadmium resistance transporter [Fructobacillus fructosus]KRN52676.1 integral membrane protein [Fructobacillus fructosus KCTC 3544]GAP01325.1 integral membrane protein [Fructobacillus fructosus]CAK1244864.1 Cadmium resistance protein CadD [Fructobacillus fructosus]